MVVEGMGVEEGGGGVGAHNSPPLYLDLHTMRRDEAGQKVMSVSEFRCGTDRLRKKKVCM